MKKNIKLIISAVALTLPCASFAFSSLKEYPEAQVAVGAIYAVPLNELYERVNYELYCQIHDIDNVTDPNLIEITTNTPLRIQNTGDTSVDKVTDHLITGTPSGGSDIDITYVNSTETVAFRNLDFNHAISITCYAAPANN